MSYHCELKSQTKIPLQGQLDIDGEQEGYKSGGRVLMVRFSFLDCHVCSPSCVNRQLVPANKSFWDVQRDA